jgi:hypothetical protein
MGFLYLESKRTSGPLPQRPTPQWTNQYKRLLPFHVESGQACSSMCIYKFFLSVFRVDVTCRLLEHSSVTKPLVQTSQTSITLHFVSYLSLYAFFPTQILLQNHAIHILPETDTYHFSHHESPIPKADAAILRCKVPRG